jgi:DinB superfamily
VTDVVTRVEAVETLRRQRVATLELVTALPLRARTKHGIGGGTWSPKDLLGHLESWERHALDAWSLDEPAPIDRAFRTMSLHEINAREVARKASRSFDRVAAGADRTHHELLDAIGALTDMRWERPATSRGRAPLGRRLGQILVGSGPFGHDAAHRPSLEAFVRDHVTRR